MTDPGVLVIGYGNPLRGDDGVGWHAANLLARDPRLAGAQILARHQLTPELAADIGQASLVVLVDAAAGGAPGSVSVRPLAPGPAAVSTWSHHLDPETLAGLAAALYGRVPPMTLVSVAGESFAEGDRLSSPLKRALPELVEIVADVIGGATKPEPARRDSGSAAARVHDAPHPRPRGIGPVRRMDGRERDRRR